MAEPVVATEAAGGDRQRCGSDDDCRRQTVGSGNCPAIGVTPGGSVAPAAPPVTPGCDRVPARSAATPLSKLSDEVGEISIAQSRIEAEMRNLQGGCSTHGIGGPFAWAIA